MQAIVVFEWGSFDESMKEKAMKVACEFPGVTVIDVREKGKLKVTGQFDNFVMTKKLKKICDYVDIIAVGPDGTQDEKPGKNRNPVKKHDPKVPDGKPVKKSERKVIKRRPFPLYYPYKQLKWCKPKLYQPYISADPSENSDGKQDEKPGQNRTPVKKPDPKVPDEKPEKNHNPVKKRERKVIKRQPFPPLYKPYKSYTTLKWYKPYKSYKPDKSADPSENSDGNQDEKPGQNRNPVKKPDPKVPNRKPRKKIAIRLRKP